MMCSTLVRNSTMLVSKLPALFSSRVEKFSVRKYDENGEKQRLGMISVLEMLREKYSIPPFSIGRSLCFSGYRPWGSLSA
jgi:hypothetical protein